MSEKIYAWLLRLYPSLFREEYGDAALELFRDRASDERGFFGRLRLWLDLVRDLAVSIPREYRRAQPALAAAPAPIRPSFSFAANESPRAGAMLIGALLSLVPVFVLALPLDHYRRPHLSFAPMRGPLYVPWSPPVLSAHKMARQVNHPERFQMLPVVMLNVPQEPAEAPKLDAAERRRVVEAAIADLKQHYVSPGAAQRIADALSAHQKAGDYDAVTDGASFADLLTKQLREVSRDLHLDLAYVPGGIPDRPIGPTPESTARYRQALEQENCTFEKVAILAHNIGYLKLNSFPDVAFCRKTATEAMTKLNGVDAIIFDLRDNRGGSPDMMALIAAYLFDHPEYLYSPRDAVTEQSWTRSPVPGSRLADRPAYVLTSGKTASAAEQFSYDLKMLRRAILVGETTRGATHSGVFYRIDDHFGIGIPEVKAVNPYSQSDWAVVGVEPDVKVPAAEALEKAQQLAGSRLRRK
jgi:hypothetical protein